MRYELLLVPLGVYIPANVTVRREQTSLDCPPVTSVDIKTLCYYRVQFKKKFKPSPPLLSYRTSNAIEMFSRSYAWR